MVPIPCSSSKQANTESHHSGVAWDVFVVWILTFILGLKAGYISVMPEVVFIEALYVTPFV